LYHEQRDLAPDPANEDTSWLGHFPATKRGTTTNHFYAAVRAGAADPESVCLAVARAYLDRLTRPWLTSEQRNEIRAILEALRKDRPGALRLAATVIAREQMEPSARKRQKDAAAQEARLRWMEKQPPSERQISYIRSFGYEGPVPNKAEASRVIDRLRRGERWD
jgi:hypothetical protein